MTDIKAKACEILIQVSQLETDARCSVFISKLKQDIEIAPKNFNESAQFELKNKEHNHALLDSLTKARGFENKEGDYICVLYDLLLYRYPELTKGVYGLLVKYFLRKRICLESIANVQVLENKNSTKMLNDIKKLTQELKKLQSESSFWINKNNQYG